ncbi:hypothetical protein Plhal703r1_c52g0157981 [Plasmopara halstedii]
MVNKKIYTIPQLLAGWTGCSMTVIRVTQGEKTRTPTNRELIFIFHFVLGRFKHHACSSRNRFVSVDSIITENGVQEDDVRFFFAGCVVGATTST